MKVCYERELPGGYYITMTPGVYLTEEDVLHGDHWRRYADTQQAVTWVRTQPGMRLISTPTIRQKTSLILPGGEGQKEKLKNDWQEKCKLLPLDWPMLALTGRLMGWKMIRIDFPEKRPASATFLDTLSSRLIELWMVDLDTGKTPTFALDAVGENGMTRYEYLGLSEGRPQIWEKSDRHERTVTIVDMNKCKVEEIIVG